MICVNSVNVYPNNITIRVGSTYTNMSVDICPTNATCCGVKWRSANEGIATVNEITGYIYGKAIGQTQIYAEATDGSGKSDFVCVTVSNEVRVNLVELDTNELALEVGECCTLEASICPENATNNTLSWSSSNEAVAQVSCDGVVCALQKGTATITATANDGSGKSASCLVTVTQDILITSITLDRYSETLEVEQAMILKATILPENATNQTLLWESSDNTVASVNPTTGYVRAYKIGEAHIYARAQDGSGRSGHCFVRVGKTLPESMEICPKKLSLTIGQTRKLEVLFNPRTTTNKSVTWSSADNNIAEVSASGYVTALALGTATITAESQEKKKNSNQQLTSSCEVTVKDSPNNDTREKVTVTKQRTTDGDFFHVQFENGPIWKSIGCDVDENRTPNTDLDNPGDYTRFNYQTEKHYADNLKETYTKEQLAFLYLLDPLGVTCFVEAEIATLSSSCNIGQHCIYKDELYRQIFGKWPRLIEEKSNGEHEYYIYKKEIEPDTRILFYSDAEVLFGTHTIPNVREFYEFLIDTTFDLLGLVFPQIKIFDFISEALTCARILLFASSIVESLTELSSVFLNDYIENHAKEEIDKLAREGKIMAGLVLWPIKLFEAIDTINSVVKVYNTKDITIYNRIEKSNYNVIFKNGSQSLFMKDIIDLCT